MLVSLDSCGMIASVRLEFPDNANRIAALVTPSTRLDLCLDATTFLRSCLRPRSTLIAENLFLRKQLAFYQEPQVRPRRLRDAARLSLLLWSKLCDWRSALVIVKPETLIGWHRKGFRLFGKLKSRGGREPNLGARSCRR